MIHDPTSGQRIRRFVEEEHSFCIPNENLDHVLTLLVPRLRRFNLNGLEASVVGKERKSSLHLYGGLTSGVDRERVRIWLEGKRPCGSHDIKFLSNGRRIEIPVQPLSGAKEIARRLNMMQPLLSAFVKDRLSVHCEAHDGDLAVRKFKIGIDRIWPVTIDGAASGTNVYHFEVEGDGRGSHQLFTKSAFFVSEVSPMVEPLTASDAKWLLARPFFGQANNTDWTGELIKSLLAHTLSAAQPSLCLDDPS